MHPLLRRAADRQLGIITAADARRAGYGHPEIRRLCTSGTWLRLRRGVYIAAEELADAERRGRRHDLDCLAVLLALGRTSAAVSHGSAARLWRFPVRQDLARTVRLTDPRLWRRGDGFLISPAPLEPTELATLGPIPVTSPARTLVDCAREWPPVDAVVAMDAAVLAGRTTTAELGRAAGAVRHWRGASRAVRAATLADGRAESPLETRGRLRIVGSGFPTPELQVEIRAASRLVAVVDAWFDGPAVAVEFDGQVKYSDPWRSPERVLWEEKRREDELRAFGIRFLRLAEADLGSRWSIAEDRLVRLLATPGPADRRFVAIPRAHGVLRAG
jgi:predicted transcriptional regulator of viral defense system